MKKISAILPYLFIFFLPTQLSKFFFPRFTYLSGIPIDLLAPTIYLTDILAVMLIVFNFKTVFLFFKNKIVLGFFLLLIVNIIFAMSQPIALYKSAKIIEMLCVFAVFRKIKLNPKYLLISILSGAVFEFSLAVLQFSYRHSMQGIFYFFGERSFRITTPAIAKVSMNGIEILRPYATFSHPNSLAGFYLLLYIFVLTSPYFKKYSILKNVLLLVCSMLIFISFSKIIIVTFFVLNLIFLLQKRKQIGCNFCVFSRIFVLLIVAGIFLTAQGDVDSMEKRMILIDDAVTTFISQPIVGVGIGNYLLAEAEFPSKYPYFFLQPVHNIFLLFLTEAGLLLTGYAGYFLYKWITAMMKYEQFMYVAGVIAITGMLDHYWLTLQQNMLLLPVVLGLIVYSQKTAKDVQ